MYGQRTCGSELDVDFLQHHAPATYQHLLEVERHTQNYVNSLPQGLLGHSKETIFIPVVVHVLHNGEAIGTGKNISDEQIFSQIKVLNEDFSRMNDDRQFTPGIFAGVASDMKIQFRLACRDDNNKPTLVLLVQKRMFKSSSTIETNLQWE